MKQIGVAVVLSAITLATMSPAFAACGGFLQPKCKGPMFIPIPNKPAPKPAPAPNVVASPAAPLVPATPVLAPRLNGAGIISENGAGIAARNGAGFTSSASSFRR